MTAPVYYVWVKPIAKAGLHIVDTVKARVLEGCCPHCGVPAVTELPDWLLVGQATHICNPGMGGCGQSFGQRCPKEGPCPEGGTGEKCMNCLSGLTHL